MGETQGCIPRPASLLLELLSVMFAINLKSLIGQNNSLLPYPMGSHSLIARALKFLFNREECVIGCVVKLIGCVARQPMWSAEGHELGHARGGYSPREFNTHCFGEGTIESWFLCGFPLENGKLQVPHHPVRPLWGGDG